MSEIPPYFIGGFLFSIFSGYLLSVDGFRISDIGFRVPGFGFRVCWSTSSLDTASWFAGFGFRASFFGFRVSFFGFRVSGFVFRVPGSGFQLSGFGIRVFKVPGFGFRACCSPPSQDTASMSTKPTP